MAGYAGARAVDLGHLRTDDRLSLFFARYSCTLRHHIDDLAASARSLSREHVHTYAMQVASGLAAIHESGAAHRSLHVCQHRQHRQRRQRITLIDRMAHSANAGGSLSL